MDSRGSRRGRRRWKPVSSHPIETTATSSQPKNIFYCTFSGCNRFFSQQYEWVRHEESVHYPQKKWICCQTLEIPENVRQNIVMKGGAPAPWPQNFDACLKQPEDHRTFYRKDHLVQHIQQVHLGKKSLIPTDLLQLWADDACEPLAGDPILRCGFCGDDLPSWTARRHHVAAHFKKGLDMSAWWPSRKRIPFVPDSAVCLFSSGRFTCPLCNKEYSDCESAALEHHHCAAWSCRFLVNFESTFTGTESARCKLCSAQIKANPFSLDGQWHAMRLHCEYHRLRDCDQDIYSNFEDFTAHMCTHRQVELEQAKEELFDDWCTRLRWSTNKQQ
ncbi:hypothetical protein K469DRAFT_389084 [Zopfia rhizophila CBS 207.26]|uniref:C2H2-type domain-containing protein n=1 Tax=Zopfia rhizophila CBS 207.26 TaxID=1314779 RepID=A0A6A6EH47_9PEZI|nr:hypothetical protein K469DRAFT_389084 [Zopfia rhizophila CBS 207.26]